ncbi:MAG: hypothetical protein P9L94_04930 [Candidatus Hinthialibacter antarcticus]|nr:hypothetical protein [Candidatus Hinthialibacter antarcticus]
MNTKSNQDTIIYPLTFQTDTSRWPDLLPYCSRLLSQLTKKSIQQYRGSHQAVETALAKAPLKLHRPIVNDEDAKAILDVVFESEEALIKQEPEREEAYRRLGRHLREHLADRLLREHLKFLDEIFADSDNGAAQLAERLEVNDRFDSPKSLARFMKKIQIYREVESFVHSAELSLSSIKIRARSSARAARGNLWPTERREKYAFLESLADGGNTCPPFTEADLEFLVSQSSVDMLKKKTDLLMSEMGFVEPNRLKANYSRLSDHLQRSKQRKSDHSLRRDLLNKMGATPDQIDYISARATYQTMKNLLRLANGNLAISDLMGGKRTIRKLLRRRGKSKSQAEIDITRHLIKVEGIDRRVAEAYARTRKNHSLEHLMRTINFLKDNYRRFYRAHWGFRIKDTVLRRAMELGLSRNKLSKRSLATKDFLNDLRRALALEEALVVKEKDKLTPEDRRLALEPFKEVLDYETDTDTRKQLYFIYEQFCSIGLCIPKDKLKQTCMKNSKLFPTQRKVQDALEILNGAYRAIGQHGETLCVLPDYIKLPEKKATHVYAHHAAQRV